MPSRSRVIIDDRRELRVPEERSIAMQLTDADISAASDSAQEAADELPFGDAVIWEGVEAPPRRPSPRSTSSS
jgi:hypothetical protein